MDTADVVEVGSRWLHTNGREYTVICIANAGPLYKPTALKPGDVVEVNLHADSSRRDEYPALLLVIGENSVPAAIEPKQIVDASIGERIFLPRYVIYRDEGGIIWGKKQEGFLRSRKKL